MNLDDALLILATLVSVVIIVVAIPHAFYCLWVYRHRTAESELLSRFVRWVVVSLAISVLLLSAAALLPLSRAYPDTFAPLPRPWGTIVILLGIDVLPLFIINTARAWRRLRRDGRAPEVIAPHDQDVS